MSNPRICITFFLLASLLPRAASAQSWSLGATSFHEPLPWLETYEWADPHLPCTASVLGQGIDPLNVPLDPQPDDVDIVAYFFESTPVTPCETIIDEHGNTEPIYYTSYIYATLLPNTHKLKPPLSKLVGTKGNPRVQGCGYGGHCFYLYRPNVAPGQYYLRMNSYSPDTNDYQHTNALQVWLTRKGVADFYTKSFDITNEKTVRGGEYAQFTARVVNYGALGGEAASFIIMSDSPDMVNYEVVDTLTWDLPGGGGPAGSLVSGSFLMPQHLDGVKYFGMITGVPGVESLLTAGVGQRDKVNLKPDLDFVGTTWEILEPLGDSDPGPLPIAVAQLVTFTAEIQNKGNSHSSEDTLIQVEIKKKNKQYKPVEGALFPIGSIPCTAEGDSLQLGPFAFPLTSVYADFDDWGKKRQLRLRIVNSGAEWTQNNNKSKRKKIRVKEPEVAIETVRSLAAGEWALAAAVTLDPAAEDYEYEWSLDVLPEGFAFGEAVLLNTSSWPDHVVANGPQAGEEVRFECGNFMPDPELRQPKYARLNLQLTAGDEVRTYSHDVQLSPAYGELRVDYTAFILCDLIPAPYNIVPGFDDYFTGDGHGFGFPSEPNRLKRYGWYGPSGSIVEVLDVPYDSSVYEGAVEGPGSPDHCDNYCRYSLPQGAVAACTDFGGTEHNPAQYLLDPEAEGSAPPGTQAWTGFSIKFDGYAGPGCLFFEPADIDYQYTLDFREDYSAGGILLGYSVRITTQNDGFPWHQVHLPGLTWSAWDPCETGETVNDLAGNLDAFNQTVTPDGTGFIPLW